MALFLHHTLFIAHCCTQIAAGIAASPHHKLIVESHSSHAGSGCGISSVGGEGGL
jgi:hypothetical protein